MNTLYITSEFKSRFVNREFLKPSIQELILNAEYLTAALNYTAIMYRSFKIPNRLHIHRADAL